MNNHSKIAVHEVAQCRTLNKLLRPLPKDSHKGDFGHVLVAEGHPNFRGASRLGAYGALRAGAGLVTILSQGPPHFHPGDLFEFMKKSYAELTPDFLLKIDALVLGPGLSQEPMLQQYGLDLIKMAAAVVPIIVLDADGLGLLKNSDPFLPVQNLICTPHPGEAARLLGISCAEVQNDRLLAIEKLAQLLPKPLHPRTVWVLKGASTLVHVAGCEIFAFAGDTPILAVGGSGDVLSGAIAGLIKQCASPLDAALVAISLQLHAAQNAQKKASKGIFPTEIADHFPLLLRRKMI